jgi:hypothetical protein
MWLAPGPPQRVGLAPRGSRVWPARVILARDDLGDRPGVVDAVRAGDPPLSRPPSTRGVSLHRDDSVGRTHNPTAPNVVAFTIISGRCPRPNLRRDAGRQPVPDDQGRLRFGRHRSVHRRRATLCSRAQAAFGAEVRLTSPLSQYSGGTIPRSSGPISRSFLLLFRRRSIAGQTSDSWDRQTLAGVVRTRLV